MNWDAIYKCKKLANLKNLMWNLVKNEKDFLIKVSIEFITR